MDSVDVIARDVILKAKQGKHYYCRGLGYTVGYIKISSVLG